MEKTITATVQFLYNLPMDTPMDIIDRKTALVKMSDTIVYFNEFQEDDKQ